MKSAIKGVKIAAVVIYVLALILNFVGTIFMFMDRYSSRYYSDYYDKYIYHYYDNPEAGVMPLCAFLLTVIALIFVCCSGKKPKLLIGTLVLFVPIELLLGLSILIACGGEGITGYLICTPAIGLVFIGFILSIILMIMNFSEAKKEKAVSSKKTVVKKEAAREIRAIPAAGNTEIFEELRALKELLDTDTLTLSEYCFEKEKMLKRIR